MKPSLKIAVIALVLVALACKSTGPGAQAPIQGTSSGCGGYAKTAKTASCSRGKADTSYCSAERLEWEYKATSAQLSLTHRRIIANCGAKFVMYATVSGTRVEIVETDTSTVPMDCICPFDTYIEVDGVSGPTIGVGLGDSLWQVDLTAEAGTLQIDTSGTSTCCGHFAPGTCP